MVKEKDVGIAFLTFTAEDTVLIRNNSLVIEKRTIKNHFKNQSTKNTNVSPI